MWHMTCDTWHVTHDMGHLTCDTWRGVNILSTLQLPSSFCLGETVFWRYFPKGSTTDSVNYRVVCRTDQATQGQIKHEGQCKVVCRTLYNVVYYQTNASLSMFVLASLMPCALSSSCPLTLTYLSSLFGHLYFVLSVCILIILSLFNCPNYKKFIRSLFIWYWSFPAPAPLTIFSLPLPFEDVQHSYATENSWWNWFLTDPV